LELFETYDAQQQPLGLMPRDEVHAKGLWHRSSQVFVFDRRQRLLIQQRAANKDLYADLWDYSVGEHLQPGETFIDGAYRGLQEELGITNVSLAKLGGERWMSFSGKNYTDCEIQQAFSCTYDGPLTVDTVEVQTTRYIEMASLQQWIEESPQSFTPWLLADLREFELII
jgi:isopentenyl-diphosphate delta-isomerase type 1